MSHQGKTIATVLLNIVPLLEQEISTVLGKCHVDSDLRETFFYIPIRKLGTFYINLEWTTLLPYGLTILTPLPSV